MSWIEALILGIIQGLAEFLPVSSSGHVALGTELLNIKQTGEENLMFSVVVHVATALSTIIVFRKDIWDILKSLFAFKWNEDTQFIVKIIISMIPAVFVGLFFEEELDTFFEGQVILIGFMLVVEGLDVHVPKGYIYFALFFSLMIELLNMRMRKKSGKTVELHKRVQEEE